MTITVTLTVDDTRGVDTKYFFPGMLQAASAGGGYDNGAGTADSYYSTVFGVYPYYYIYLTGSDFAYARYGRGVGGNVTSLKLTVSESADTSIGLAHIDFDFGDTGRTGVPIADSNAITPDTLLNVMNGDSPTLRLIGNIGGDTLYGSARADILDGKAGADVMMGRDGNDRYYVDNAKDVVVEGVGGGSDYVLASTSYTLKAGVEVERLSTANTGATTAITLAGNEFGQRIEGNAAANKIMGFDGADTLYGNAGGDALYGGNGKDVLIGGLGNDSFMFDTALGPTNVDTISDFHNVTGDNDTIRLANAIFTKLAATGPLAAGFFAANATGAAADSNDYIVYNTSTGALFYDADGNGAGKAVQFATLTGHPTLTAADFVVF